MSDKGNSSFALKSYNKYLWFFSYGRSDETTSLTSILVDFISPLSKCPKHTRPKGWGDKINLL